VAKTVGNAGGHHKVVLAGVEQAAAVESKFRELTAAWFSSGDDDATVPDEGSADALIERCQELISQGAHHAAVRLYRERYLCGLPKALKDLGLRV